MFSLGETLTEVHENKLPAAKKAVKALDLALDILAELEDVDSRFRGITNTVTDAYLQTQTAVTDMEYDAVKR